MAKKNVTMQDIADKLNVSKVTVSKALGDKDGVGDELKSQIKQLALEMGYRINTAAQAFRSGLSKNIGVLIAQRFTGEPSSYYTSLYQKLSMSLSEKGYSSILQILKENDEENLVLPSMYNEQKIDGLIVIGQLHSRYIDKVASIDIPIVFTDFYDEHQDIDSVVTDNFFAAYTITNYIINNGHKKIAYIGSVSATSSMMDRYLGYIKSLIEHSISLREDYLIEDRDSHGKVIDCVFPEDMPTAFVCNCDQVAYKVVQKLQVLGYRVPEDISVVGFDNDIHARLCKPMITTIDVNSDDIARVSADLIINKIETETKQYGRILVKGQLVIRESVVKK